MDLAVSELLVHNTHPLAGPTGGPVLPRVVAIGAGPVDLCQGERNRADEQPRRADASPRGDMAQTEPGIAFTRWLQVRGADDDGSANAAIARPERDGLSGTGDSRPEVRCESAATGDLKKLKRQSVTHQKV
jgi:hypothetical protein